MNSRRLFLLPVFSVPFWLWNNVTGVPHLQAGSLWPFLYAALALGGFLAVGWWLFEVDDAEQRRDWLRRCTAGCFGGILTVYLIGFLASQPLLASLFTGMPGLVMRSLAVADHIKDASMLPLWASVIGYTLSVGVSEEFSKAAVANSDPLDMLRERAAAGFGSGVGFGLGEALIYSFRDYAGESPWQAYVVRFIFCVGFHGAMSAVAVLCLPDDWKDGTVWLKTLIRLLPICWLHGAYDALLFHGYSGWAGIIALAVLSGLPSFIWWREEMRGEV
jgi:hypothetical protein